MILAIRSDKPQAELYLLDQAGRIIDSHKWLADRKLADSLLPTLEQFLEKNKVEFKNLTGLAVFTGQGSFTGLRIGTTVANGLAYGLKIKVVKIAGENWLAKIIPALAKAKVGIPVVPDYDKAPNITHPENK